MAAATIPGDALDPLHSHTHAIVVHTTPESQDWSRYADDPGGVLNTRLVGREERRRQFQVELALADTTKSGAVRHFHPLFEEADHSGLRRTRNPVCLRLKVAGLRLVATRTWDKLYLCSLGAALLLLPATLEDDWGLGCRRDTETGGDSGADKSAGDCGRLWPFFALMSLASLPRGRQRPISLREFPFGFLSLGETVLWRGQ